MRFGTYYFLQAPPSITHPDVVRRKIEQMAWTEALGFDSIWLTEHHFHRLRSLRFAGGPGGGRRDAEAHLAAHFGRFSTMPIAFVKAPTVNGFWSRRPSFGASADPASARYPET
jgi:alkanesulfonate monooxygenase SsuD/methylene tetrahydromethanopterin reductase-like flavin-dependent oxidoreductase (luciferase family)